MFKTSFKVLSLAASLLIVCSPLQAQQTASGTGATVGTFIPPSVIMPYAGSTAPAGWVLAYGQQESQTGTYAKLFAAIGSTYCTADHGGTCTGGNFRLPDLRGRFLGGKDNMGGTSASRMVTNVTGGSLGSAGGNEAYTPSASFTGTGVAMNTWSAAGSFQDSVSIPALSFSGSGTLVAHTHSLGSNGYAKIWVFANNFGGTKNIDIASLVSSYSWNSTTGGTNDELTIIGNGSGVHTYPFDTSLWNTIGPGAPFGVQLGGNSEGLASSPSQSVSGNTTAGTGTGTATARSNWFSSSTYTPAGGITGSAGNNLPPTVIVNYIIKI